jgi:hypothetical protein
MEMPDTSQPILRPGDTIVVAIAEDGHYGSRVYDGTGHEVSSLVLKSVSRFSSRAGMAPEVMSLEGAIEYAKGAGATVLIVPQWAHYEDRNTPWSGRRDHISLDISIYHVADGEKITATDITANNSSFTFINHRPIALLPRLLDRYVASLFR